jgi:hypothetical protein
VKVKLSAMFWLALCAAAFAQDDAGTIAGKVTDPSGAAVMGVSVEARNTATGAVYKVAVSSQGEYTLAQLPADTYDVSVPVTRGPFSEALYMTYIQKNVTVEAGRTLQLDIAMKVEGNLATLGDQPISLLNGIRARATIPTGPTPRMADGKPDLSGFWLNETGGEPPVLPLLPWAEATQKERQKNGTPSPLSLCLPSSPIPIAQIFPYQLVQTST